MGVICWKSFSSRASLTYPSCGFHFFFWYSVDADMEDYGFEYLDEEQDVDIENQYYNSKGISNNYF